jgi:hypothetical protein
MTQWSFVIAAYAVAIGAVVALVLLSFRFMRRWESEAEKSRDRK